VEEQEDVQEELPAAFIEHAERGTVTTMQTEDLRGMGLTIDDDEDPVPENIPTNNNVSEVVYDGWSVKQNICPRRSTVGHKKKAKLNNFP